MGAVVRAQDKAVQARDRTERAQDDEAAVQGRQYLTFVVGGDTFAIAIASIKEIIEHRAPTRVPMMPAFMCGVINLRGHVVPVIDLSVRFGRSPLEVGKRTCIVIVEVEQDGESHDIGIMVDAVSAVLEIADSNIEPAPSFGAKVRADFIGGMGKINERFVVILEIDRVLSVEELSALSGAAADAAQPGPGASAHQG